MRHSSIWFARIAVFLFFVGAAVLFTLNYEFLAYRTEAVHFSRTTFVSDWSRSPEETFTLGRSLRLTWLPGSAVRDRSLTRAEFEETLDEHSWVEAGGSIGCGEVTIWEVSFEAYPQEAGHLDRREVLASLELEPSPEE